MHEEKQDPRSLVGWHVVEVGLRQAWPYLNLANPESGREVRLYIDTTFSVEPGHPVLRQHDPEVFAALDELNCRTVTHVDGDGSSGLRLGFDELALHVQAATNELTSHEQWWFADDAEVREPVTDAGPEPGLRSGPGISREDVVHFVRSSPRAVVATLGPSVGPQAALVDIAATEQGELVFNSRAEARKIRNIAADSRVAVVIGCDGDVTLQVEGLADVVTGAEREHYGSVYQGRFPGARALVDGFSVVRVRPAWVRRYDAGVEPPRIVEGTWSW